MLAKENRLTKKKDFDNLLKYGKAYFSASLILKLVKNNLNISRFGFIVSKKVTKKAVARNKLKRRLREIIRKDLDKFKKGIDCVLIVKNDSEIINKNFKQIKEEIDGLFKKAKLIK